MKNPIISPIISLFLSLFLVVPGLATAQQTEPTESNPFEKELPTVIIHTSKGNIKVELYEDQAPVTVKNFLDYARKGHYDGTVFHRVIPGFMIQGGGFDAELNQKPVDSPIKNEADNGLTNQRGAIAMARTNDPDSATAQFFINTVDNPSLDHRGKQSGRTWGYAVFGRVTEGMDVVDEIRFVETQSRGPHQNVPVEPVVIESVEIL
ncbi:MAG: peptidylprolyl isomerase [Wenzhouxiangellaceae bacterium]